jgi:hypothetical protein
MSFVPSGSDPETAIASLGGRSNSSTSPAAPAEAPAQSEGSGDAPPSPSQSPPPQAPAAPVPVAAPYRTVQVTFGEGPMGIDLKTMEGEKGFARFQLLSSSTAHG